MQKSFCLPLRRGECHFSWKYPSPSLTCSLDIAWGGWDLCLRSSICYECLPPALSFKGQWCEGLFMNFWTSPWTLSLVWKHKWEVDSVFKLANPYPFWEIITILILRSSHLERVFDISRREAFRLENIFCLHHFLIPHHFCMHSEPFPE